MTKRDNAREEDMGTHTILAIEEGGLSKTAIEAVVPEEGCTVTIAPGYVEALYKLSRERFDLVLTGGGTDNTGGIELLITAKSLGFVKTQGNTTQPVFVLFCETTDEIIIRKAWSAGYRHIISKSVARARLPEILYECTDSPEGPSTLGGEAAPPPTLNPEPPLVPPVCHGLISILRIEDEGLTLVYHLSGNLSKGTGYTILRDSILHEIRINKKKQICLNCHGVNYVNSSGIAGLVSLREEVSRLGAEFSIIDAQEQVFNVLVQLDLLQVLQYRPAIT
jgi:anti-anti-sigma factor